ncbi:chorismate synthase [candidate division WOR-1 bacterium RIFOXYB2_FULL_42_35]|uniref:Chorismate synthase n=1 Tax=candidate division WOR-1 bacterium RIFOXYC2_FULL_41_25 TaxID=1802586 RepID=A0A1F4TQY4_UNCSA|nr:MAG: chorismate synthase [candidate division WOR-1 bacterium RIFOXYA2_FULL_41_14]OGC24860.1 MAG: chorismate synthase [candidate division WOR-1 bacterium RIFOXYB2_FULL_42_35]OGC35047.1 MAG: chorismate synthase [candidate division WOR-1 bacterium RIFOXYC2_FULL_41_25]OGC43658.1 MAG: chorismate synthase [candidate division WOR-1 bacterium RIFOXYD2_FULL_41_8]
MLRYLTAGESHGPALVAILEGIPANLALSADDINRDLARRQQGYGRGDRMKIEQDKVEITSGVRNGKTIGSPIAIRIINRSTEFFGKSITQLRPGHADLAGALKYNQKDVRNILERSSARETAAKVAVGVICKKLLSEYKINFFGKVVQIGGATKEKDWQKAIDEAREKGDTLGGVFEITVTGVPVGLGSHVQRDRCLDGKLAQAIMAIQAVKGVEIGLGFEQASLPGSKVHDEIFYDKEKGFYHKTNNAGGIEGGMSNGEPIIIRAAVKPIATLKKPLKSVDLVSKKPAEAFVERSDVCAVEPAVVVGEAAVAIELATAFLEKFSGDSLEDISAAHKAYLARII